MKLARFREHGFKEVMLEALSANYRRQQGQENENKVG
jgi:hypothetical protein